MEKELVDLGLIATRDIKRQNPDNPALKKYFMHGAGHSLGLAVHDVSTARATFQPGWVMTVEPAIYIPEEKMGIRLENNVLVTETGQEDLMANIPIEIDEIEGLMAR
jgi:Xaa-Pro aminopeptidase